VNTSELSELAIAPAESDADLEAVVQVRRVVAPEAHPQVENLRFNLEAYADLAYLVAWLDGEAVGCAFVEPVAEIARAEIAVVPSARRRGVGTALLREVSERARALGKDADWAKPEPPLARGDVAGLRGAPARRPELALAPAAFVIDVGVINV
jgi:GNAT superfamily N-acetyltransferase